MTNILFIQGAGEGANKEDRVLVNYVENALGSEYVVKYPLFTGLENVEYDIWKAEIKAELEDFKNPLIIISHSLGGAAILKFLSEEEPDIVIAGLFLIATPYKCKDGEWAGDDFALETDFASTLPNIGEIFLYHSKDDEWVPFSHLSRWKGKMPTALARQFDDRGHSFSKPNFIELVNDLMSLPVNA